MIFVTGGTGLVGAHLLFELTNTGHKVRALKRKNSNTEQVLKTFGYYSKKARKLYNQIEWVEGDMLDYFSLEGLFDDVSEIYHCAAIVSFESRERAKMIANNVEGTANLVNIALEKKVKKFCHVSSIAALGKTNNQSPVNESTAWTPSKNNSGYSESKFYSEAEVWRGIQEGLDAVIVNPSIILGPANWESGSARLFHSVWKGMKFYTLGTTGYVGVKDVVRAMITLMDDAHFERCKNQRYLLSAEDLSYRDLFCRIADALNRPRPTIAANDFVLALVWRMAAVLAFFTRKTPFITKEAATGRNAINHYDGSKITRETGFSYTPIDESIKETAACLLKDFKSSQ